MAHQEILDFHSRRVFRVHGKKSFTLIELLVVVAIIMLLAALQKAKAPTRPAVCKRNLIGLRLTQLQPECRGQTAIEKL